MKLQIIAKFKFYNKGNVQAHLALFELIKENVSPEVAKILADKFAENLREAGYEVQCTIK